MSDNKSDNRTTENGENEYAENNDLAQQAAQEFDTQASNPSGGGPDRLAGGMGISSERTGETGPGQHASDGVRATDSTAAPAVDADGNAIDPQDRPDPTTRY